MDGMRGDVSILLSPFGFLGLWRKADTMVYRFTICRIRFRLCSNSRDKPWLLEHESI
jgi:hypothetical protein